MQTGFSIDQLLEFSVTENSMAMKKTLDIYELKAFRLINFKAFRDTGWIMINRLTLLYGNNSSGKTALYQVLQMVLDAYRCLMQEERFTDISYMEKKIGKFDDLCNKSAQESTFKICFHFHSESKKAEYCIHFVKDDNRNSGRVANVLGKQGNHCWDFLQYYHSLNLFFLERKAGTEIPIEVETLAGELLSSLRRFAKSLQIFAAHRYLPERVMQLTDSDPQYIGITEKNIYNMLYALSEIQGKKFTILQGWLEKFDYTYRWNMTGVNQGEFLLRDLKTGIESNLVDNGFGISQSLPLAAALDMIGGKTVLVDSPEAFLQTRMQSEMGDLLIEGSKDGRILLETGSEYLMLRIRRRIAEGLISKEEITVYYLEEKEEGETVCHKLILDELGEFLDMPESFMQFFSSDYEDIEKLDKIRRKKLCSKEL